MILFLPAIYLYLGVDRTVSLIARRKLPFCFLVLFLFTLRGLSAQSLSMSAVQVPSQRGVVTVHVTYATPAADVAGLQWSLALPVGVTVTTAAGAADTTAAKTLLCRTDGTMCLVYGVNQTMIGSGDVAVYTVTFPANTPPGNYTFTMSGVLGVSTTGSPLSVAAAAPLTVSISSSYDLNSDGVVNSADVTLAVNQALGKTACNTADFNGDGACNLVDVQAIIRAALGF